MTIGFAAHARWATLVGAASAALISGQAFAQADTVTVNIPSQNLERALAEFGRQTGRQILFSPTIAQGRQSRIVRGTLDANIALQQMLGGTDITVRQTSGGAFLLVRRSQNVSIDNTSQRPLQRAAVIETREDPPITTEPGQGSPAGAPDEAQASEDHDIVVTGTLIRGVAPGGSNVVGVSREQIEAIGAATTDDLLARLPQATNFFNALPIAGQGQAAGNTRNQVNRPNLRNLPGGNTATGASTLILVDGHRVVGAGIGMLAVDPEIIPPGAIERVEVITDGGSAVYGSDALGGVINLITRKQFDGIRLDGHIGFARDYQAQDVSVTAGTSWDSGSIFTSYTFASHDSLRGLDRDYVKQIDWNTGLPTGRFCDVSNITRAGIGYLGTNLTTPGGPAMCDNTDYQEFYPAQKRHNVFAGFNQDIADGLKLELRGFYQHRRDEGNIGPLLSSTLTIPTTNFYRAQAGLPANQAQTTRFSYGPVLGRESGTALTVVKSWDVTPTLSWDFAQTWQIRAMVNYGESDSTYANNAVNTSLEAAAIAGTTATTAINPYDIAATANKGLITDIGSFVNRGQSRNAFLNPRLIVDGRLFTLPGGDVHLALGAEYMRVEYSQRTTNTSTRIFTPWANYVQTVKSVFGEVAIPIFSEGNRTGGAESLSISVSGRYDKYNDFGSTFNPKIGITWKPVQWFTLRGNWGKSFNAPTPPDQLGSLTPNLAISTSITAPAGFVTPPGLPVTLLVNNGAVRGLQPQTARTWSLGFNVRPPILEGLALDVSYYRIALKGSIASPFALASGGAPTYFANFPELSKLYPNITPADIAAFFALNPATGPALATQLANSGQVVASIIDVRNRNLGNTNLAGLDFALNYSHPTSFGSVEAGVNGNYQLTNETQPTGKGAFNSDLPYISRLRASFMVGARFGQVRTQATLNHSEGFTVRPSATVFGQTRVRSFDTVNIYVSYQFEGDGLSRDLSLSLNVNNLFDSDPPRLQDSAATSLGYTNGATLGRFIQLGLSKKF